MDQQEDPLGDATVEEPMKQKTGGKQKKGRLITTFV